MERTSIIGGAEEQMPTEPVTLTGVIGRIVFRDQESGFSVFRVHIDGLDDPVTVRGILVGSLGETVTCDGVWERHPQYGPQLNATDIVPELPTTQRGVENYLSSGILPGVGPVTAKKIVAYFGEETLEILDKNPAEIEKVPKLNKKLIEKIITNWKEHSALRELMVFLRGYEISSSLAYKIHRVYGARAMTVLQNNPWRMARDIKTIGFKKADEIAVSTGCPMDSPERIIAALSFVVSDGSKQGHCGIPESALIAECSKLLSLSQEMVSFTLHGLPEKNDAVVRQGDMCWVPRIYEMESEIAEVISDLVTLKPSWGQIDAAVEIPWVEQNTGNHLAENQKRALALQLSSRVMIVTGGPGCGKTFLLNSILKVMARHAVRFILSAPTGKAAVRMTESTGYPASTLHRLMKIGMGNDEPEQLNCDLLVVDEFSMVDIALMHKIIKALPAHASILLVGDSDQLPSVGPGAVLFNLIDSGRVPFVRLNHVFRQANGSLIIDNAHQINAGRSLLDNRPNGDFFFLETDTQESGSDIIDGLVKTRLPAKYGFDPMGDIQVLCPMNRGVCGTFNMNFRLQESLNPRPVAKAEFYGTRYGIGDRVMQVVNNYDKGVFNGDSGLVVGILDDGGLAVQFAVGVVEYDKVDIDELVLSYAMTIHKSQGSDFPAVIIPMFTSHYMMLQRNLLYTGVTRARLLCVVVGQRKAVDMAIKNNKAMKRNTRLLELLSDNNHC
ncbi:ATP-dependent RecD-like DNA helicase [Ferrovum sp.]|uniref:SF1B family DNA helicase RecD2 n=1 Tax=Ferrovum sp. TaxID=2609467 RepID=UPI00260FD07C|nr:ATP-dependent RecD-like DNA helicase [Ferrovum sp.]